MIYWINFMLYLVMASVEMLMHATMLTPKYPNGKSTVLFIHMLQIPAIIKFFMPLGSVYEVAFTVINAIFVVIFGCILFKEKLKGNLLAIAIGNMLEVLCSLLYTIAAPEILTAGIDTLGSTVLYSTSIIMFAALVPAVRSIKQVWDKMRINMAFAAAGIAFIVLTSVYYVIMSSVVLWFSVKTDLNYRLFIAMLVALSFIALFLTVYLLLRREEEYQQTERLRELEIAWKSERANYDTLLSKMGQMERIRHDFYGQLAAARHIMTLDRERGSRMIEELKGKLLQEKESDILD